MPQLSTLAHNLLANADVVFADRFKQLQPDDQTKQQERKQTRRKQILSIMPSFPPPPSNTLDWANIGFRMREGKLDQSHVRCFFVS